MKIIETKNYVRVYIGIYLLNVYFHRQLYFKKYGYIILYVHAYICEFKKFNYY